VEAFPNQHTIAVTLVDVVAAKDSHTHNGVVIGGQ